MRLSTARAKLYPRRAASHHQLCVGLLQQIRRRRQDPHNRRLWRLLLWASDSSLDATKASTLPSTGSCRIPSKHRQLPRGTARRRQHVRAASRHPISGAVLTSGRSPYMAGLHPVFTARHPVKLLRRGRLHRLHSLHSRLPLVHLVQDRRLLDLRTICGPQPRKHNRHGLLRETHPRPLQDNLARLHRPCRRSRGWAGSLRCSVTSRRRPQHVPHLNSRSLPARRLGTAYRPIRDRHRRPRSRLWILPSSTSSGCSSNGS